MHWKTQENKGAHYKTWQNIRKQGYIGKQGETQETLGKQEKKGKGGENRKT